MKKHLGNTGRRSDTLKLYSNEIYVGLSDCSYTDGEINGYRVRPGMFDVMERQHC